MPDRRHRARLRARLRARPLVVLTCAAALMAGVGAGAVWFQPWRLWTTTTVLDEVPVAEPLASATVAPPSATPMPTTTPTTTGRPPASTGPTHPASTPPRPGPWRSS